MSSEDGLRSQGDPQDFTPPLPLGPAEAADLADARLGKTMSALQDEMLAGYTVDTTCAGPNGLTVSCSPARPGMDSFSLNGWVSNDCDLIQYRSADGTRLARLRSCRVYQSTSMNVALMISHPVSTEEVPSSVFRTERTWIGATTSFVYRYYRNLIPTSAVAIDQSPYVEVRSRLEDDATPFMIREPAQAITDFDPRLYSAWRPGMQLVSRESVLDRNAMVLKQWVYHAIP